MRLGGQGAALLLLLSGSSRGLAQELVRPPCGGPPLPSYAAPGDAPQGCHLHRTSRLFVHVAASVRSGCSSMRSSRSSRGLRKRSMPMVMRSWPASGWAR